LDLPVLLSHHTPLRVVDGRAQEDGQRGFVDCTKPVFVKKQANLALETKTHCVWKFLSTLDCGASDAKQARATYRKSAGNRVPLIDPVLRWHGCTDTQPQPEPFLPNFATLAPTSPMQPKSALQDDSCGRVGSNHGSWQLAEGRASRREHVGNENESAAAQEQLCRVRLQHLEEFWLVGFSTCSCAQIQSSPLLTQAHKCSPPLFQRNRNDVAGLFNSLLIAKCDGSLIFSPKIATAACGPDTQPLPPKGLSTETTSLRRRKQRLSPVSDTHTTEGFSRGQEFEIT
jgi:hypothetical protein